MQVTPDQNSKLSTTEPIGAQLYSILRGQIIRNELQPGTRLSEAGIAAEYQISRQPVREVFIRLADEGLLEVRPQRGTIVPRISERMVEDARFIREAIEADVVKRAAAKFDRAQIAELDRLLEQQKRAEDVRSFVELDDQFHRSLADGIGRAHAWHVIEALKAQLDRVRYLSLKQFPKAKLIEQHSAVIEAIRAGDPGQAEAAMRRHLNTIVDDLPVIAAEQPDHFD